MKVLLADIWASFTALTRLPLWRLKEVPPQHYQQITDHWSLVGWLTGGVMMGVLWLAGQVMPLFPALMLTFISRILLTGALHEDGLMDLFDGFGGGRTRQRILEIMKDSHTGAYATIGFVCYALAWISLLSSFPLHLAILIVGVSDPLSKFIVSHLPMLLPYARKVEESKMQTIYRRRPPLYKWILSALFGLAPLLLLGCMSLALLLSALIAFLLLTLFLKRRLNGYTGDCIGALFLLTEVCCYLGAILFLSLS